MPVYEYQCKICNHTFEKHQKMSDDPIKECPKCQGEVEKIISASSFILNGTGWYKTDNKD